MRDDIIPVHLIRRGPLTRNSGGPIRVISDILETYSRQQAYAKYGYVSVNDTRMFRDGQPAGVESRTDGALKHSVGKSLNTSNIGLYLQLRRDEVRLKNRLRQSESPGRIIHSHDQLASGLALAHGSQATVLTLHSKGSILKDVKFKAHPQIAGTWMQRVFERLERSGIASARVVTFPSQGARALFSADVPGALDSKDVRIVYNGIDTGEFDTAVPTRAAGEPFTLINVSALVDEKRFDRSLDIIEALQRMGRDVRLIHVGDGRLADSMRKEAQKRGLGNVVIFKGRMEHTEVLALQQTAHAFLLPAERTVFDIATLEAMASGLPVIITREGGNLEMIVDGKEGFLCNGDDISAFSDRILQLVDNEELRQRIGNTARETAFNRFSLAQMIQCYDSIYNELASANR